MAHKILAALVLLGCVLAVGQKSDDADKQKLSDIEHKFAAISSFASPEMTDAFQKYLYDGTSSVVVLFGHLYHGPKSEAVAATKTPDPNDPDVKMTNKPPSRSTPWRYSQSYRRRADSGHKNPALNGDYHLTCLDTYLKRKGRD